MQRAENPIGGKRRILVFSTAYYPYVGGAEVAVRKITDLLPKNYEFDLITARLDKNLPLYEKVGKVNVYRIGFGQPIFDKLLLPIVGGFKAYKMNKEKKYFCFWGIMVTFGSLAGYVSNAIIFLTRGKKVPLVLTLQEGDSEAHLEFKWMGLINISWRLALLQTDTLTAISNFLLNRAKKKGWKGESFLVPNGVDVGMFSKEISQKVKKELKEKLGKKDGDIFLLTTGRLTHKNAVDDIISALPKLPSTIQLLIIGKGDEGATLQKLSQELGVDHRVKFLGFMPYEDIPKYLSISDIFIRPSRSEGFGNSFIEAMASKIPVIATPVGGIVDFIDDRETGLFCSTDNPSSIAQSIIMLLNDKELKEKMVFQAFERVRERYSWEHVSLQMERVFDKQSR